MMRDAAGHNAVGRNAVGCDAVGHNAVGHDAVGAMWMPLLQVNWVLFLPQNIDTAR